MLVPSLTSSQNEGRDAMSVQCLSSFLRYRDKKFFFTPFAVDEPTVTQVSIGRLMGGRSSAG